MIRIPIHCFILDGQYAAFGKVVEGMNIVDEIASVPTDFRDRPQMDMRIKSITLVDETVILRCMRRTGAEGN